MASPLRALWLAGLPVGSAATWFARSWPSASRTTDGDLMSLSAHFLSALEGKLARSRVPVELASCKTLASTGLFHFSPFHLRRLGQEPPPTPRYGSERSRNFAFDLRRRASSSAAVAFALQHRSASRHRDVTAPLIARAAPRRRRSQPPARLRLSVWAGLHNNSPPALK